MAADRRIDTYIERASPFARPILTHLRKLVRRTCPDVVETMKWSSPSFEHHGLMCGMASFKEHCVFGFWKAGLLKDDTGALRNAEAAMGSLGRLTSKSDLPPDSVIAALIRQAMRLNEEGVTERPPKRPPKPAPRTPSWFLDSLRSNRKALSTYEALSPSHKREYLEWLVEAKREDTRSKRLATALRWLSAGKNLNWRYERPKKKRKP